MSLVDVPRSETSWGADGYRGTWSDLGPGVAARRIHAAPPEPETDDSWWWIVLCTVGRTGRGAGRTVVDSWQWLVDIDSAKVAHSCAEAVRHGASSEQWLKVRRERARSRWCRWSGAACGAVGCAGAWWWSTLHLTPGERSALVIALILGALWWCWWYGAVVEDDVDGIAPRMPAPLSMPSAPMADVPTWRPPTDREFLIGALTMFHPDDDRLTSAELAARMSAGGGWWAALTAKAVGNRLSDIGLRARQINFVDESGVKRNRNGFTREDIERALGAREPLPRPQENAETPS